LIVESALYTVLRHLKVQQGMADLAAELDMMIGKNPARKSVSNDVRESDPIDERERKSYGD
jgi:hypothetical protein